MRKKTKYKMMKYSYLLFRSVLCLMFFLLFLTGIPETAFGCRYNVRETGFVYLAQKPYQLIIYYSDELGENDFETIQQQSKKHFLGSNIKPIFVNINSGTGLSELETFQTNESIDLPWAILKSADGQILKFPLKEKGIALEESAEKIFRNISFSKERDEVIQKCISNYGVVLILEGRDRVANKEAHKAAKLAISHVESKMSLMPKKINAPPVIVSIKNNNTDEVLNWSLGIEKQTFEKPKVFVVYGRGRWIGPVLETGMISKRNLSELLIIIGADCECGIDREWMRGTMIPFKWDISNRKSVTENLEFDPENPLIKKEVRNILRMGEIFANIPQNDSIIPNTKNILENPELKQVDLSEGKSNALKYTIIAVSGFFLLIILVAAFVVRKK